MYMKRFRGSFGPLAASLFVTFACALPAQAAAPLQVELHHRLPESRVGALADLVERFNAQDRKSVV